MRFKTSADATDNLHMFIYGDGGCGKTKAIGDFHEAGQNVVLVTVEEDGPIPLRNRGIRVPVLFPDTVDDLLGIILAPDQVTEKIIQKEPGFEDYEPRTWAFDGLRGLQRVVMGYGTEERRTVLGGQVELPHREGHGVMGLPGARPAPGIGSNKDYRILDDRMRNIVGGISQMPYHTIITAHYEKDFDIETVMSMTGDQKNDKDVVRRFQGYPALDGFKLKYDLPNICSAFYLFMKEQGGRYTLHSNNTFEAKARTKIAEVMEPQLDWTGKNLYTLLQERLERATKVGDKK